ncbi:MAG: phage baseplate assembly protein [Rhodospirillales bacterium]|nr:phage baseplate assembly protein [Rhodospirillales bacterium]
MADELDQVFGDVRGIAAWGVVSAVEDGAEAQTVTVQTADGAVRTAVEVAQPFGLASVAPANGALCVLLAVGADPANLVALPVGCPAARMGELAAGEVAIYGADGSRVHIRAGGTIEVWGAAAVKVTTQDMTIEASQGGVQITGTVTVTGDLNVSGNVADGTGTLDRLRQHYDGHVHPDPQGGDTGPTTEPD